MKSYADKLKDPRWQKKRLEIMERDGWECTQCGKKEDTLHVHHLFYERGKQPWEAETHNLTTLCENCHEVVQEWQEQWATGFARLISAGHNPETITLIVSCMFKPRGCQPVTMKAAKLLAFLQNGGAEIVESIAECTNSAELRGYLQNAKEEEVSK